MTDAESRVIERALVLDPSQRRRILATRHRESFSWTVPVLCDWCHGRGGHNYVGVHRCSRCDGRGNSPTPIDGLGFAAYVGDGDAQAVLGWCCVRHAADLPGEGGRCYTGDFGYWLNGLAHYPLAIPIAALGAGLVALPVWGVLCSGRHSWGWTCSGHCGVQNSKVEHRPRLALDALATHLANPTAETLEAVVEAGRAPLPEFVNAALAAVIVPGTDPGRAEFDNWPAACRIAILAAEQIVGNRATRAGIRDAVVPWALGL